MLSGHKNTQHIIRIFTTLVFRWKTTCHLNPYCDAPPSGRRRCWPADNRRGAGHGATLPREGWMKVSPAPLRKGLGGSQPRNSSAEPKPHPCLCELGASDRSPDPTHSPTVGSETPRRPPEQPGSLAPTRPPPPSSFAPAKPSLRRRPHRVPQLCPVSPEPVVPLKRPRRA